MSTARRVALIVGVGFALAAVPLSIARADIGPLLILGGFAAFMLRAP